MALTKNEKSLCNKLVADFDSLIAPAKMAKGAINTASNTMKNRLTGMTFSDPGALDNALNDYNTNAADNFPGDTYSDMQNMKDFIDGCDYLQFLTPVSAVFGMVGGVFDKLDELINGYDTSFPEFGAGGLGSLIDKLIDGINVPGGDRISDLLAQADKLLSCLSNSCAAIDPTYVADLNSKTIELQQVYDDLGLISDPNDPNYGKFDYSVLYNEAGLSSSEIEAINKAKGNINGSKDAGADAISKSVDAIKNATKLGDLF